MTGKRFLSLLLLTLGLLAAAASPQVSLSQRNPRVGEVVSLLIESDEGSPELLSYPRIPQVRFLTNRRSQSIRMVNFRTSYSTSIAVQMLKAGRVTLSQLKIRTGKKTYTLPPITLNVRDRNTPAPRETGSSAGSGSIPFGELTTAGHEFYAGQEIPVECTFCIPATVEIRQLDYPRITLDKAVFSDFRKLNPDNPRFLRPVQGGSAVVNGIPCRTVIFRTSARIFEPGQYTFEAVNPAAILEPDPDEDDDPFFSFRFFSGGRARKIEVPYAAKPFTVKPLPPAPSGTFFTGLIGAYSIRFALNGKNPAVGELLTLECRIEGENAPDTLKAPELDLPGFRVYPPEVRKEGSGNTVIRYAMIPLQEGRTPLHLALTVFDVKKGEYRTFRYEKTIRAAPPPAGRKPVPPVPAAVRRSTDVPSAAVPLWKLQPADGVRVALPLWRNCSSFVIFSAAAGFLLICGSLLADLLRRRRENDPAYARSKKASAAKKAFLAKLRRAENAADLLEAANRELCEYLGAKLGLPAGASATEIAAALHDPADAELLEEVGESAFRPGGVRSLEEWKTALQRLLKHVGMLFLVCCGLLAMADETRLKKVPLPDHGKAPVQDFHETGKGKAGVPAVASDEGRAAFERGDNKAAIRCFAGRCRSDAPEPAMLHNLGCAFAADGNDPMALLAFTQSLRLAPRSSDTLERLNAVRVKLLLPPERSTESPAELLRTVRDQFRPDEYASACAALFLLFAVLFCFRRKLGRPLFSGASLALLALGISFLLAIALQLQGPYSPRNAFITARKAELRTLPAAQSGRVEATLSGGTPVTILDEREHYVLISGAGLEGWVRRADVASLFSPMER